ncbi:MAG: hypothetical protein QXV23_06860, partial [Candidatus Bathyarchaeia archaeon]
VDGWALTFRPLINVSEPDMVPICSEPDIPMVIGEWDFMLGHGYPAQFRGVEVIGLTDQHDANDDDIDDVHGEPGENVLDREVVYLLNEVFNPWDLLSAVHKWTKRDVIFGTGPNILITEPNFWLVPTALWDQYCVFSERVIDLTTGRLLNRWRGDYTITRVPVEISGLVSGRPYKILYSKFNVEEKIFKIHIKDGILEYYLPHPATMIEAVINITDPEHPVPVAEEAYEPIWATVWGKKGYPAEAIIGIRFTNETGYECYECNWYKIVYRAIVGRYEWIVVGRDAATVDSAGAALVSEAFDSIKNIEVGIAGADMKETQVWNAMPWVMHKFGTGNTKEDYKDALGRAALKDDWCRTWPVASSNLIAVGGPLANMLAYYANDFTPAFFGLEEYASEDWAGKIIALSCWSQKTYESTEDIGYAVVATYKDLNGTVLFLVWGHWGRDTYYATQWLWGDAERGIPPGIIQLQECAFHSATAIILKIDYTDPEHPTFSVVEVLGTISERAIGMKGGIHQDP